MISIQTNVNSLVAQQNLATTSAFQSKTIQQLTSGYRINSSGDDAAGLAVANKFRSSIAELTQGVANGNDAAAQLQIMDGGMNNISQILDRLKTLATQSASGTFTGKRETLNSEFQTDLAEIDRQAQSIGLNTGGTFATSLQVFLGAGSGSSGATNSGAASLANSQVGIDLSRSSVDSQSLGLKGMSFSNVDTVTNITDIGKGAGLHSVANIVASTSGNATATTGYTTFNFSGAGFSGANKMAVNVNLSGVTDVATLAANINTAIKAAGDVNSQSATCFKSAGISASVRIDANGGQELAFTSSTSAFQVEAGDQMSNALLGNFNVTGAQSNWTQVGKAITTTVAGAVTTTSGTTFTADANGAKVRITGAGLASPVELTLTGGTVGAVITDLQAQMASPANSALQAAGITVGTVVGTAALTFTSAAGEAMSVQVTGDTTGALGFGKFASSAVTGNRGADYVDIVAGAAYAPGTAIGTSTLQFSLNGGVTDTVSVDLSQGAVAATAVSTVGTDTGASPAAAGYLIINGLTLTNLVAGDTTMLKVAAAINAMAGITVNAVVDSGNHLVLTNKTAGPTTITIGGTGAAALFGASPTITSGSSSSLDNVVEQLNAQFAVKSGALAAADLKAVKNSTSVEIISQNGTYFRVGSTTAASADIGFGGNSTAAYVAPTSTNTKNYAKDAGGVSYLGNVASTNSSLSLTNTTGLTFTGMSYGSDSQAVTLSANSASGQLQSTTITLQNNGTNRSGADIDSAITAINTQLQRSNNSTLQSIVAVKEVNGTSSTINFISSKDSFSVGLSSNISTGNGINAGVAGTFGSTQNGAASNISIDTQGGAQSAITAIVNAVAALGSAQASVGKGQNQLNYAINLASSQITNFSAAESQIRDANVAQQAANLSKAQVLSQAGIAAMAQANSAPQAVLSLLRG